MKRPQLVPLVKGLLVAIATSAAAPSAKADLTLEFSSGTQTYSLAVANGSSATNVTVGDFTVSYTVHLTAGVASGIYGSGPAETLSLDVTAVKGSDNSASDKLSFDLLATGLTNPPFANAPGVTYVTSSITGTSSSGNNATTQVGTQTLYSSEHTITPLTVSSGTYNYGTDPLRSTFTGAGFPTSPTYPYSLETKGAEIFASPNGSVGFTATAQVISTPEPSGVIAALAGLPCMGLVLAFARRQRRSDAVAPAPVI